MVMTEKANEIAYNALSGLASGMQSKALCVMICSGVVVLGIGIWMVVESRRGRQVRSQD
jgi:hypothetical protein